MLGKYQLKRDDVCLGVFDIDQNEDKWIYTAHTDINLQPLLFKEAFKRQENQLLLSGDVVRMFLVNRAPESNYSFIDALMDKAGIKEYDPLAFVLYNGGRFNTDKFYLTGPGIKH